MVIKQCLKGKSVALSRSRDIKERLTWEAIEKVRLMAQIRNPATWDRCFLYHPGIRTVVLSRHPLVTVGLIMRYALRLRRWWILAKAITVMALIINIIIHQTHYQKSDWSRAFNQFTIACKLDMINAISAADIAFIISSSTSAWLLSPLECSPQKQNGWTLRFCFWGWIKCVNV